MKIIDVVRSAAAKKILFVPHATRQMSRTDRMISTADVEMVIRLGEVIEDYPEDARGIVVLFLELGKTCDQFIS